MILAAGFGKRMRPLTLTTPKPLLTVAGQPLIVWHILALKAAGVTDIVINAAWLAEKLIGYLGDGSHLGVHIQWSVEPQALETAGGIRFARHLLGDEPFILVNGDVWSCVDYAALVEHSLAEKQLGYLLLINNPEHNPTGDFELQQGLVMPKNTRAINAATYTFAGISVLHPRLVDPVVAGETAALAPLLVQAMQQQAITAQLTSCQWVDVGTPKRLAQLNEQINKNGASQHPAWQAIQKRMHTLAPKTTT